MNNTPSFDLDSCLSAIGEAQQAGSLTESAVENIKIWLTDSRYADYAPAVAQHIAEQKWKELDDVFWTIIPFGTGGRRAVSYTHLTLPTIYSV